MSLFDELKRRNVFKVTIAYIVMAWLVMQVADVILNNIEAPGWVFHVILLLLGIGLLLAVFFAWAFEMTPEGIKHQSEVDRSQSITHETGQKLNYTIIAVLVLALGYFAYDKFVLSGGRDAALVEATVQSVEDQAGSDPTEAVEAAESDNSIAVLPFADMSPDSDQEYFSDGLSEELLNLLAKIPELRVAARTSAWSYKGKDIKIDQVGKELGVAHVLEGSVRTAGNRIRVTAQLIKSDDGFHLWSETYDRTLDDVFAIQDEISGAVVDALKLTLLGEAPHVKEINPEAYSLFLQAQHLSNQLRRENYKKAIDLYEQVIEIEPGYAPAWSGISRNYRNMGVDQQIDEREGFRLAFEAIEKALSLDPDLAEAHARLASLYLTYNQDPLRAAEHFRTATQLNSNDPDALQGVAEFAVFLGQTDKAIQLTEAAILRDPVDALAHVKLGDYYFLAGRSEEAIASYRVGLNLNPELLEGYYKLATVLLIQGNPDAALVEYEKEFDSEYRMKGRVISFHALGRLQDFESELEKFRTEYQDKWPSEIAHVYAWTGNHDAAFEWLDKAVGMNEGGITNSRRIPWLKPLHDDPRWQVYLEKIGISDAQIAEIEFEF
jgi:TolB-like protein/Tfp pilus assembly protein PilF